MNLILRGDFIKSIEAKNFLTQIRSAIRKIIKEETSNNMKIGTAEVISINGNLATIRTPYSPEDGSGDFEVPMVTRQEISVGDIVNIGYWCNLSTGILLSKTGQSGAIGPGPGGSGVTSFNGRTGVVTSQSGDYSAEQIGFTPSSGISSNNVQDAIEIVSNTVQQHINNKNNPHEVTIQQIGAASDEYGLGEESGKLITDDLNNANQNGWYTCSVADGTNAPEAGGTKFGYGIMHVTRNALFLRQDYYPAITNVTPHCVRIQSDGVWSPWEWVNPPMFLGVEYRTTERYNGKPVYSKYLSLGSWADKKTVEHGIENIRNVVRYQAFSGGAIVPNIYNHNLTDNWCRYIGAVDATSVYMECGNNVVGNSAGIVMYYTKTTD